MKRPMMSNMPAPMPRPTVSNMPAPAQMPPTKAPMPGARGFSRGGVTRGDGCITKGHTKGKKV